MATIDPNDISQLPPATPQLYLDQQLDQARNTFKSQYDIIQQKVNAKQLDVDSANKAIAGMQAEFDKFRLQVGNMKSEMQRTQTLMDMGIFPQEQGNAALWEMVLPTEVAKRVLPNPNQGEGQPFTPGQLQGTGDQMGKGGYIPSIKQFARAGEISGHSWNSILPGDQGKRSHQTLVTQYQAWRDFIGYNAMTPIKQQQVDDLWDTYMNKDKRLGWDPKAQDVLRLRARGPAASAFVGRSTGTPTNLPSSATPLAQGIAAANQPASNNGKVHMQRPDGTTGWVNESEVQAAKAAGLIVIP